MHHLRRGSGCTAADVMRAIMATDSRAQTAHDLAAGTEPEQLPALVARLLIDRRAKAAQTRRAEYRSWQAAQARERQANRDRNIDERRSRDREQSMDYGLDL